MSRPMANTRRCYTCKEVFPATPEFFHRRKAGLVYRCKPCARGAATKHYYANHDKALRRRAEYRDANREALREWFRTKRDKAKVREAGLRYRAANLAKLREGSRRRYYANTAKHAARCKEWRAANRDRMRAYTMKKNLRRRKVPLTPEAKTYVAMIAGDPCAYCGKPSREIDHIVPVSRGGTSEWSNLTMACRRCNNAKHARPLIQHLIRRSAA